jgi:bifunctional DNA-binding transcriptional regulator/antitoxin component of YhaV-PrlF toxin-antitoxin module
MLSQEGEVVLPLALCEQLHLMAGDNFEISIEDDDAIVLRRVSNPPNRGLVEHLLACPVPFGIPDREKDESAPISL